MSLYRRIGVIYAKELISILRDRRTMLAMVVIPVVLYPVLMLGFLRAAESEQSRLRSQRFVTEVSDERTATQLAAILKHVPQSPGPSDQPPPTFDIRIGNTPPSELGDEVQFHITMESFPREEPFPPRLAVTIVYNEINVRSRTGMEEISNVFRRYGELLTRRSLTGMLAGSSPGTNFDASRVDLILSPIEIAAVTSATEEQRGGWALGQIVPVILVLMTITGAIYPAIDLTAGERERGTLEALLSTPVPTLHLIVAKFLVVATIGLLASIINVSSVGATMHFGGVTRSIADTLPVQFPASAIPIIILCMIPFAMLSSAILIAACSFARSFKEAQNYVTPIIIIALIPAIGASLPSVRLQGILLVVPVGNMVLLTRELFQQTYTWTQVAIVLFSTTLYAAAAVGIAARLFGQEAVLFADAGSYKTLFQRRLFRPRTAPTASQALLLAAVLFPTVFYVNSLLLDPEAVQHAFVHTMTKLTIVQFLGLFVLLPIAVAVYLKTDIVQTFRLQLPALRCWPAAICIGLSTWILIHEFLSWQASWLPPSQALEQFGQLLEPQFARTPLVIVVLLLAVVPAVCEEFLFRGFLLSGMASSFRKWPAIIGVAVLFGLFHFIVDKIPATALLGIVLAYTCWQSRSVWPAMIVHVLHNGTPLTVIHFPQVAEQLGLAHSSSSSDHLPILLVMAACAAFVTGVALLASLRGQREAADTTGHTQIIE